MSGDDKLEAAAVSDPAHIMQGANGQHVSKIQQALISLDRATIVADGAYGPATAAAVLAYKQARRIINPAYQSTADAIVGKMTIASLDDEMFTLEQQQPTPAIRIFPAFRQPLHNKVGHPRHVSGIRPVGSAGTDAPIFRPGILRIEPYGTGVAEIVDGAGGTVSALNTTRAFDVRGKTAWIYDLFAPMPPLTGDDSFGGTTTVVGKIYILMIWGYRPGDTTITAASKDSAATMDVAVRAPRLGFNLGFAPPTRKAPDSQGYISGNDSEANPTPQNAGRPINPLVGEGRNINLGGERETPNFEDYTTNLTFSGYVRPWNNNKVVFRPWTEDAIHGVSDGGALNICSRGTPLKDDGLKAILRIAAPRCRLTFIGDSPLIDALKQGFGGRELDSFRYHDGSQAFVLERP